MPSVYCQRTHQTRVYVGLGPGFRKEKCRFFSSSFCLRSLQVQVQDCEKKNYVFFLHTHHTRPFQSLRLGIKNKSNVVFQFTILFLLLSLYESYLCLLSIFNAHTRHGSMQVQVQDLEKRTMSYFFIQTIHRSTQVLIQDSEK